MNLFKKFKAKLKDLLPRVNIGKEMVGFGMETEYEEPEKGHRICRTYYSLHPGDAITSKKKEAFAAAQKTNRFPTSARGAGTGWKQAWMNQFSSTVTDAKSAGRISIN